MGDVRAPFQPVDSADQVRQYRDVLEEVSRSPVPPELSSMLGPGSGIWRVVSVWMMSVYLSGGDRLDPEPGNTVPSQIEADLKAWDQWLYRREPPYSKEQSPQQVEMVSVPLTVAGLEYDDTPFADQFPRKDFKRVRFGIGRFEAFAELVDSISERMGTSHWIWVYKGAVPICTALHIDHERGADGLSEVLEKMIY